jgi:Zn-dependent protease
MNISDILARVIVLVVGFTVHEFSHAWTADQFGDDTPRLEGRLTLNPLAHIDIFGALMLMLLGFGWAKPVRVNEYTLRQRSPAAPMLVSLAGPASSLVLAIIAAIPLKLGVFPGTFSSGQGLPTAFQLLYYIVFYNLVLAFFNMLPIFPLDGEKVLMYFLPPSGQSLMERLRQYSLGPMLVLLVLLPYLGIPLVDWVVFNPATFLTHLLI